MLSGVFIYCVVAYNRHHARIVKENIVAQQTAELSRRNAVSQCASITALSAASPYIPLFTGTASHTVTATIYLSTSPTPNTFATKVRATIITIHGDSNSLYTGFATSPSNADRASVGNIIGGRPFLLSVFLGSFLGTGLY